MYQTPLNVPKLQLFRLFISHLNIFVIVECTSIAGYNRRRAVPPLPPIVRSHISIRASYIWQVNVYPLYHPLEYIAADIASPLIQLGGNSPREERVAGLPSVSRGLLWMAIDTTHGRLRNVPQAKKEHDETDPGELPATSPAEATPILIYRSRNDETRHRNLQVDLNVYLVVKDGSRGVASRDLLFEALDAMLSIADAEGSIL